MIKIHKLGAIAGIGATLLLISKAAQAFFAAILAAALLATAIGVAVANRDTSNTDGKFYTGFTCMPVNSGAAFYKLQDGEVYNNSAASQSWTCPITRDHVNNNVLGGRTLITHSFITESSGAIRKPSCSFYAFAPDGSNIKWATADRSRNNGTVFNDIPADDGWNFSIACTVPGSYNGLAVGLGDYMVFEKT
jgi:hypothetical protein